MWSSGDWFLHHDNAPAHRALSVQQFLAKNNTTVIPRPPYSPDLAPCDFSLFPRYEMPDKKGKRFADVSEVKKKTLEVLKNISTEVTEMFSAVGKTLIQVYRVKRGVHRKRLEL